MYTLAIWPSIEVGAAVATFERGAGGVELEIAFVNEKLIISCV